VEEAENILRVAVKHCQLTEHPETFSIMSNLTGKLLHREQYADAEAMFRAALAGLIPTRGADSWAALGVSSNLATALLGQGRQSEALVLCQNVARVAREKFGAADPRTVQTLNALRMCESAAGRDSIELNHSWQKDSLQRAFSLVQQHQMAEAVPLLRQALAEQRAQGGAPTDEHLQTVSFLLVALLQLRRPEEAEPLCDEAIQLHRAALGDSHEGTLAVIQNAAPCF
jgi:tetratricopeptide (TPR) repeat protein